MFATGGSEGAPPIKLRLNLEINTREHFTELGLVTIPLRVENRWFSGTANVTTFAPDELLGTKLRALYQRKKGRDLFDLWMALDQGIVNATLNHLEPKDHSLHLEVTDPLAIDRPGTSTNFCFDFKTIESSRHKVQDVVTFSRPGVRGTKQVVPVNRDSRPLLADVRLGTDRAGRST